MKMKEKQLILNHTISLASSISTSANDYLIKNIVGIELGDFPFSLTMEGCLLAVEELLAHNSEGLQINQEDVVHINNIKNCINVLYLELSSEIKEFSDSEYYQNLQLMNLDISPVFLFGEAAELLIEKISHMIKKDINPISISPS